MRGSFLSALRSKRWSAYRRVVAMLCLSLFVFSGVAHATQCLDCSPASSVTQEFSDASDKTTDRPVAPVHAAHCHGCMSAFEVTSAQTEIAESVRALPKLQPADALRSHLRRTDTPPPKA